MSGRGQSRRDILIGPLAVWIVLLGLIGLTTVFGYLPLDHFNAAINIPIAGVMVALAAVFLMRLREAPGLIRLAALTSLVFLFMMFFLTFGDYVNR